VGIRPEGFILNPQGKFGCTLRSVEIMGRDCSFVLTNEASQKDIVRAIVDAANRNMAPDEEGKIHFDLKPNKVFIFDANTEKRIYIEE
jgi:multiple sugar transport system ATP-binding protein